MPEFQFDDKLAVAHFDNAYKQVQAIAAKLQPTESFYLKRAESYTDLQAGELEESKTPKELITSGLIPAESFYTAERMKSGSPLEYASFDNARADTRGKQMDSLRASLSQRMSDAQILPAKGSDEFTVLKSDIETLQRLAKEAKESGKPFGDIWTQDVDKSKLTYYQQVQLRMQERAYELSIEGKTGDEVNAQIQREFAESIQRIEYDQAFIEKFGIDPHAPFNPDKQVSTLKWDTGRSQFQTDLGYEVAKLGAAIGLDVGVSMLPYVGVPLGLYMTVTGDDVIINSLGEGTGEKLPWWARVLTALPAIGPAIRGGKALTQVVSKSLNEGLGSASSFVYRGGVNRMQAALQNLRDVGKFDEINDLVRQIDRGEVILDHSEQELYHIIKAVSSNNRGAASAILRRGDITPSPLVDLAKFSVLYGDELARQKITDLVLRSGDKESVALTKKLIDTLGVDDLGLQLIKKDIRVLGRGDKEVSETLQLITNEEVKLKRTQDRLENLKKARAARQENLRTRKVEADRAKVVKEEADAAPDFEEMNLRDATKVEEAAVGASVPLKEGGEGRVVEVTDDVVVVADDAGELIEVVKSLSEAQRTVITNRVREFIEAGRTREEVVGFWENYRNGQIFAGATYDDLVGAVKAGDKVVVAGEPKVVTEVGEKVAEKVKKVKALRTARKEFDEVQTALMNADDIYEGDALDKLDSLIQRLDEDIINHPTSQGHQNRVALRGEMKKFRKQLLGEEPPPVDDLRAQVEKQVQARQPKKVEPVDDGMVRVGQTDGKNTPFRNKAQAQELIDKLGYGELEKTGSKWLVKMTPEEAARPFKAEIKIEDVAPKMTKEPEVIVRKKGKK